MKLLLSIVFGTVFMIVGIKLCKISAYRSSLPQDPSSGQYWDPEIGETHNGVALRIHAMIGTPLILMGLALPILAWRESRWVK